MTDTRLNCEDDGARKATNGEKDRILRLEELISVKTLQQVQDNFSAAVGIAIVTVDEYGTPVTRPSGFCGFCDTVRSSPATRDACLRCDNGGGRIAMSTGKPSIYLCHCGLVDFAAPIIAFGQYLGAIISGQVRLKDEDTYSLEYIVPPEPAWQADPKMCAMREQVQVYSYEKLHSVAYTLFYIASSLAEESYSNMVTQELCAKQMRLAEESRRRTELEKNLREAELQALSYQVNPHFLFNVLNTIGRLALMEHAEKTETIVYAFADMMRYILKKSRSQLVPLRTEVDHVRNYLYIQQVRMGSRFSFTLDIPSKYDGIHCPFMALHPIVENSINYAVEPHAENGVIAISAYDDGEDLFLVVKDNGDGIAPELLRAALDGVAEYHGRTSIGLCNVNSRLLYFFGEGYGLAVESTCLTGEGTTVTLRFPLEFDPCAI